MSILWFTRAGLSCGGEGKGENERGICIFYLTEKFFVFSLEKIVKSGTCFEMLIDFSSFDEFFKTEEG